ncbi:MAG: hypothetical protein CM15mV29_0680 [uncultured marine virus]|nr:MAG: hypothetical protein CM15mV29_0680 [uncultured marine virus]
MKRYENDDDIPTSKSKNCIVCLERRFRGSIADAVELGWLKTKKEWSVLDAPTLLIHR